MMHVYFSVWIAGRVRYKSYSFGRQPCVGQRAFSPGSLALDYSAGGLRIPASPNYTPQSDSDASTHIVTSANQKAISQLPPTSLTSSGATIDTLPLNFQEVQYSHQFSQLQSIQQKQQPSHLMQNQNEMQQQNQNQQQQLATFQQILYHQDNLKLSQLQNREVRMAQLILEPNDKIPQSQLPKNSNAFHSIMRPLQYPIYSQVSPQATFSSHEIPSTTLSHAHSTTPQSLFDVAMEVTHSLNAAATASFAMPTNVSAGQDSKVSATLQAQGLVPFRFYLFVIIP